MPRPNGDGHIQEKTAKKKKIKMCPFYKKKKKKKILQAILVQKYYTQILLRSVSVPSVHIVYTDLYVPQYTV